MKYPAIHEGASISSDHSQRRFYRLVIIEYTLLISVAVFHWLWSGIKILDILEAIAVVSAIAASSFRILKKPDEDWYQFRALAESAKTLSWRFAMRANPFDVDDALARATMRNRLKELVRVNATLGGQMEPHSADAAQITESMEATRSATLENRKETYRRDRIQDQRAWYTRKAASNKILFRNWSIGLVAVYLLLLIVLIIRTTYSELEWLSPDPLLVVSASFIGWIQVKKFNDLAASYLLTAQEIGIAATEITDVDTEDDFSKFVSSAELAFSREHTQWVARRRD